MTPRDLSQPALDKTLARLHKDLAFYTRLRARMDALGWDQQDAAYRAVADAEIALRAAVASFDRARSAGLGSAWELLRAAKRRGRTSDGNRVV